MVGYLSYMLTERESEYLLREIKQCAAHYTDERWEYYLFKSPEKAARKMEQEPCVHLFGWDVTDLKSIELLQKIRRERKSPLLLVVADEKISPTVYLKPSIAPEALLLKPFNKNNVQLVLQEIFLELQNRLYRNKAGDKLFTAESREGRLVLPLESIDCFEAKNKKIYVRSGQEEYGFYSSIKEVEKRLPDEFVQCHRSYIANMGHVRNVDFVNLMLHMKNGIKIPFSRQYRKLMKEYWSGR